MRELADEQSLVTDFLVPDAASEISVRADLKSRSSRISMTLRAPEDRKRPEARLNWLLGQLKAAEPKDVEIVAYWPGRAKSTYGTLAALRADPKLIIDQNAGMTPTEFEVAQSCHTPASFAGRKRFIQDLQVAVQGFYGNVGKLLTAWSPKPPLPEEKTAATRITEGSIIDPARPDLVEELKTVGAQQLGESSDAQMPSSTDTATASSNVLVDKPTTPAV